MLCLVVGEAQLFQPLVEIGQASTVAGHLQATAVASAGNSMVVCGLHVVLTEVLFYGINWETLVLNFLQIRSRTQNLFCKLPWNWLDSLPPCNQVKTHEC